ncbi:hypothetical protein GRQ65_02475 [Nocardioides sp. YIM 123512]|uniref:Uncharacterized protein n=1 Tax=Nocardioides flavescens TaxID=2691959 RepID=A0A6L7EY88_9ACTN|nr:hypothetical protein [Nocardioides flavescens]
MNGNVAGGVTTAELGRDFGVNRRMVQRKLRGMGVRMYGSPLTAGEIAEAAPGCTPVDSRSPRSLIGRRGQKDDPLYKVRRTLLPGVEYLTEGQHQRLRTYVSVADPER